MIHYRTKGINYTSTVKKQNSTKEICRFNWLFKVIYESSAAYI